MTKRIMPPGIGYHRCPCWLTDVHPVGEWVMVLEHLSRRSDAGLFMPQLPNTTRGEVLSVGSQAAALHGIQVGDEVLYDEYAGGRWAFAIKGGGLARVLLMHSDWIHVVIREG